MSTPFGPVIHVGAQHKSYSLLWRLSKRTSGPLLLWQMLFSLSLLLSPSSLSLLVSLTVAIDSHSNGKRVEKDTLHPRT